ncbi:hypothetical protein VV869_16990 [Photobacterium sp. MCCC 1A19761]|uniref:hypothetical protein n=1 Tax=Photobacterium sp. MCCC 1A19761 TaxID=3115000 RepID=UPI00307F78A4
MIKFYAALVHVLLWLKVAVSPMCGGLFLAGLICIARDQISLLLIASMGGLGFVIGAFWAERIRKNMGLITFHGRLIGHPEIDGAYVKPMKRF